MPELTTTLSPTDALDHIEEYLRDWTDARLPQSLREQRIARLALDDRRDGQLTIRFALAPPSKLVRYCDCVAEATSSGSRVRFTLRGPWRPRTAGLMVLALFVLQAVYQLFTGTFDRVTAIIGIVVPSATAYLAHVDNLLIRKKYREGMMDVLQMALHIVPANTAGSTSKH